MLVGSTFKQEDVSILLTDLTGKLTGLDITEREQLIQNGTHYSEMLPIEYKPSTEYLKLYETSLKHFAKKTARAVGVVAEKIWGLHGEKTALVSLARAGITTGILIKHYLQKKHGKFLRHYAISIIRDKGLDTKAMQYILERHTPENIQFVDGWTGKGTIARELAKAALQYPGLNEKLAVLADPAGLAGLCGTREDFLVASSCLNATISGLLSRTVLNHKLIGPEDFHGAVFYKELIPHDRTYEFINTIEVNFPDMQEISKQVRNDCDTGNNEAFYRNDYHSILKRIQEDFGISDIKLIKPGIGEAARVLLRRLPWKLLVYSLNDETYLGPLYQLAKEKHVDMIEYPLHIYKACGLIRQL